VRKILVFEVTRTPKLSPMNIAFIFADGEYYAKTPVGNPHDRHNPTFKVGFRIDCENGADLYIAGQKCPGIWTGDFYWIQKESRDPATYRNWRKELSQDLQACEFTAEEFPELKDYI
jgi:hypothetical protein